MPKKRLPIIIELESWRSKIGYVPQELFLFNDTILSNIILGDASLSEGKVESALRSADAWDFVSALPEACIQ